MFTVGSINSLSLKNGLINCWQLREIFCDQFIIANQNAITVRGGGFSFRYKNIDNFVSHDSFQLIWWSLGLDLVQKIDDTDIFNN